MGAWIEIYSIFLLYYMHHVAPHVGAWIEIVYAILHALRCTVAPHVGAWIEITFPSSSAHAAPCRSPRGSVD